MNTGDRGDISEDELHAYVDGQLPAGRIAAVEAWLADNPRVAEEVAGWKAQAEGIRDLFGAEPEPGVLPAALRNSGMMRRVDVSLPAAAIAACLLLALGAGAGAVIARLAPIPAASVAMDALPEASRTNYVVYASEVRHPVEVRADERDHLDKWLSKRLGSTLKAPDLSAEGFSLVGGRLVSFAGAAGALFMYEDAQGKRITLMAGRNIDNAETGFLFAKSGDVQTFYWIDGPVGYALSGAIDRKRLEVAAHQVYRQL
jgi:anti-sigma factor RsiW